MGKFFLARRSNNGAGTLDKLVNPGDVVALAAPSTNPNLFGLTNRGYTGCSYNIANGTLSFQKLLSSNAFPRRYKREPGED